MEEREGGRLGGAEGGRGRGGERERGEGEAGGGRGRGGKWGGCGGGSGLGERGSGGSGGDKGTWRGEKREKEGERVRDEEKGEAQMGEDEESCVSMDTIGPWHNTLWPCHIRAVLARKLEGPAASGAVRPSGVRPSAHPARLKIYGHHSSDPESAQ